MRLADRKHAWATHKGKCCIAIVFMREHACSLSSVNITHTYIRAHTCTNTRNTRSRTLILPKDFHVNSLYGAKHSNDRYHPNNLRRVNLIICSTHIQLAERPAARAFAVTHRDMCIICSTWVWTYQFSAYTEMRVCMYGTCIWYDVCRKALLMHKNNVSWDSNNKYICGYPMHMICMYILLYCAIYNRVQIFKISCKIYLFI